MKRVIVVAAFYGAALFGICSLLDLLVFDVIEWRVNRFAAVSAALAFGYGATSSAARAYWKHRT